MWPGAQARVWEVKICLWGGGEQWVVTRQSQSGVEGQGGLPRAGRQAPAIVHASHRALHNPLGAGSWGRPRKCACLAPQSWLRWLRSCAGPFFLEWDPESGTLWP